MSKSVSTKRSDFRQLHNQGCFVIPNPWDVGSAKYLQSLGFKALATTSAGFAWSRGRPDMGITVEMALAHLHEMVQATDVPINADFENGFANDVTAVALNVRLACATGIAGVSIEDASGIAEKPLFDIDLACERLRAARRAIDQTGEDVMLIGRAESYLYGMTDVDEVIARLRAYAHAGADCLFAPGLSQPEEIAKVVQAISPKPFNLVIGSATSLTVEQVAKLGVRRISVGGGLARCAWAGFMQAAEAIAQRGSFDGFAHSVPSKVLNGMF
jgi:2-methylisocitrate lyase-like PEP mutase family enzyme